MLTKVLTLSTIVIALLTLWMAYTQQAALVLRQESQMQHWSRYNTVTSGRYLSSTGSWQYSSRETYSDFRGGGPGAGK
jgi:hypothetical protein